MSRPHQGVARSVVLITCTIWAVIFGGWFVATRYFGEPAAGSGSEVATTAAPAPRRRGPRRPKDGHGDQARDSGQAVPKEVTPDGNGNTTAGPSDDRQATGQAPVSPAAGDSSAGGRDEGASTGPDTAAPEAKAGGDARAIVEESERRTDAKSHHYEGLLQMFDAGGKVSEKRWTFDRLGSRGQSKVVLRFNAPAEVKGVALLIVNHPERASDQWMWTPAIERDRRIALQDRSTRFFGTDFSFEDLEERDVDQFDYQLLGNETVDGAACWSIQSTPKRGKSSQYSRSIAWIRKDNYTLSRLDNYVAATVVKRLNYSNIENIQGIWTARQLEMSDLRRSSRTRLTLQQISYNAPAKEADFTLQAIKRQ